MTGTKSPTSLPLEKAGEHKMNPNHFITSLKMIGEPPHNPTSLHGVLQELHRAHNPPWDHLPASPPWDRQQAPP